METLWFIIVAVMLTAYVVLDGFDLGTGVIYLAVAKNGVERRLLLRAIGPVWDGNEVWLLSAGGTLYFAFPQLYASSFSGFYLPLMMVLWLLMLRAIGIEFRTHIIHPVWQGFYDVVFSISSGLLAIFFGAALGNVIRGVPLNAEGYFFEPLWTNFRAGTYPGILDWYTVFTGVIALVTLTVHGALYVIVKTDNDLAYRSRRLVLRWIPVQALLTLLSLFATGYVRPNFMDNYVHHKVGFLIPVVVAASLILMYWGTKQKKDRLAFGSSCAYLAAMLVGAAFALYPLVLPSSTDPQYSLSIYNTAAAAHGLSVGIVWWCIGMVLTLGYFFFIYRMFRGKVRLEHEGH